jgi:hypothetical protein
MGPCKHSSPGWEDPHYLWHTTTAHRQPSLLHQLDFTFSSVIWQFFITPPLWNSAGLIWPQNRSLVTLSRQSSASAIWGQSVYHNLPPDQLWASFSSSLLLDSPSTTLVKYPVRGRGGANPLALLQSVQWSHVCHVYIVIVTTCPVSFLCPVSSAWAGTCFGISQSSS